MKFPFKSEFYVHKAMTDGHLGFCKDCVKKRVLLHRERNVERIREYDRKRNKKRGKDPVFIKQRREYLKKYRTPKIAKAHSDAEKRLQKPETCEICGKAGRIEAHHHDYDYPLEVIWCCPVCHAAIHKDLRERGIDLHK